MTAPESNTSRRILKARERELRALLLRQTGTTYATIGNVLGFTRQGAYRAVMRALARLDVKENAEQLRRLELERLDVFFEGVYPKAIEGDLRAIDIAVRIMQRRSKLLGLDRHRKAQSDF